MIKSKYKNKGDWGRALLAEKITSILRLRETE